MLLLIYYITNKVLLICYIHARCIELLHPISIKDIIITIIIIQTIKAGTFEDVAYLLNHWNKY